MATVQQVYESAINEGSRYNARCELARKCLTPELYWITDSGPRVSWQGQAALACIDYGKATGDGPSLSLLTLTERDALALDLADYYNRHVKEG